ncbi:hypothetical protein ACFQX4_04910 [Roseomonas sp. GCM10028921]
MRLPAVVDPVLEEVQQQPVHALPLHAAAAMDGHNPSQLRLVQPLRDRDQPTVLRRLARWSAAGAAQGSASAQAAGPSVPPSMASM